MPSTASLPLAVDLDGTLVRTDTLHETFLLLLKRNPFFLLLVPFWLLRGKAHLKAEIARRVYLDVARLPYCEELVTYLQEERRSGRRLVLATAANERVAEAVAAHLGLFSAVYASDDTTNLRGERKLQRLQQELGGPFAYAGNASEDVPIWRQARAALVVHAPGRVLRQAQAATTIQRVFPAPRRGPRALIKAIRAHQWAKNVLVFMPVIAAHKVQDVEMMIRAVLAFAAFSLCASSVYVLNDLLDLPSDRRHPTKRKRPFAAGDLSLRTGLLLAPALLGAGALVALRLPPAFLAMLGAYYAATLVYSFYLKQVMVLDVLMLAGLYTVRIFAGSLATEVPTSSWLFTFSMFLFFSLALVKRLSEVRRLRLANETSTHGRGYLASDYEQIGSLGTASAYLSVLVLALYITSKDVTALYTHPERLWLLCPLMLYWCSRVWLLAHRGQVNEDPLIFALRDRASYVVGVIAAAILYVSV